MLFGAGGKYIQPLGAGGDQVYHLTSGGFLEILLFFSTKCVEKTEYTRC